APHELPADAPPDVLDHAGVLVPHHEWRAPREEPLGGVDVGAADAGGVDGHERLARSRSGIGHVVEREPGTTAPRRDFHGASSFAGRPAPASRARIAHAAAPAPRAARLTAPGALARVHRDMTRAH